MEEEFWLRKWALNEIGFHKSAVNPLLVTHLPALSLSQDSRLFLPLCGKTRDIDWLLSRGHRVAGAELSRHAIEMLFAELGVAPEIEAAGPMTRYSAEGIDMFVGDIFKLTREMLGPVDAIYDRGALIALPLAMRERYAAHLIQIAVRAPQLLVTLDYDQSLIDGPPFAVPEPEILRHYGQDYRLRLLSSAEEPGGLKGHVPATEHVWLLTRP